MGQSQSSRRESALNGALTVLDGVSGQDLVAVSLRHVSDNVKQWLVWVMVSWSFLRVSHWQVPEGGHPDFDPPEPPPLESEYLERIGLLVPEERGKMLLIINR